MHVVEILRLHVDPDGTVWYGADDAIATPGCCDLDAFWRLFTSGALGFSYETVHTVLFLGVRTNAALACRLYRERGPATLRIASPVLCPSAPARARTAAVLQTLYRPGLAGNLPGRVHEFSAFEHSSYAIAAALDSGVTALDDLLRRHPIWPAVSFLEDVAQQSLDRAYVCRLIALVLDPRWFQHPDRPGRWNRLRTFLGVSAANARAYCDRGRREYRYHLFATAARTWVAPEGAVPLGACALPGAFLARAYVAGRDRPAGVLAGTESLLRFLRLVWLGAVPGQHPDNVFQPELFFHNPDDAAAYRRHRARLDRAP